MYYCDIPPDCVYPLCVCTCGSQHVVSSTGHPANPQASPVKREMIICYLPCFDGRLC